MTCPPYQSGSDAVTLSIPVSQGAWCLELAGHLSFEHRDAPPLQARRRTFPLSYSPLAIKMIFADRPHGPWPPASADTADANILGLEFKIGLGLVKERRVDHTRRHDQCSALHPFGPFRRPRLPAET